MGVWCFGSKVRGSGQDRDDSEDEEERAPRPAKEAEETTTEVPEERADPETTTRTRDSPTTDNIEDSPRSILKNAHKGTGRIQSDVTAMSVKERNEIAAAQASETTARNLKAKHKLEYRRLLTEARVESALNESGPSNTRTNICLNNNVSPEGTVSSEMQHLNAPQSQAEPSNEQLNISRNSNISCESNVLSELEQLRQVLQGAIHSENGLGKVYLQELQDVYGPDHVRTIGQDELIRRRTKAVLSSGKENTPTAASIIVPEMTIAQQYFILYQDHLRARRIGNNAGSLKELGEHKAENRPESSLAKLEAARQTLIEGLDGPVEDQELEEQAAAPEPQVTTESDPMIVSPSTEQSEQQETEPAGGTVTIEEKEAAEDEDDKTEGMSEAKGMQPIIESEMEDTITIAEGSIGLQYRLA